MGRPVKRDFYEIQASQKRKSLIVFAALILFYFIAAALITLAALATFGLLFIGPSLWSALFIRKLLLLDLGAGAIIAWFHTRDARRFGAAFILKRLEAAPPIVSDLSHKEFINILEEIRIAAGIPRVKAYVLPASVINSLALVEEDGTPAVAVTEGMLAGVTRNELQAVVAHELAHIARGDAFIMTLVCSLADLFERLKDSLEPEAESLPTNQRREGGVIPIALAAAASWLILKYLSAWISREREILADAAAVEFSRDPEALATVIYKAHVSNSFIGDFSSSYGPLFIVAPESRGGTEGLLSRIFGTHPPLLRRIGILAAMTNRRPGDVMREVWGFEEAREKARTVLRPFKGTAPEPDGKLSGPEAATETEAKIWYARHPKGVWEGPWTVGELLCLPFFTSLIPVRNSQEKVEAKAREFPQVRLALKNLERRIHISPSRKNECPRCRAPLVEAFYEGVPIRTCLRCGGKLVGAETMERIIARRQVAFSDEFIEKAAVFRDRFLADPVKTRKISECPSDAPLICPECGYRMTPRPYNYSYFLPVDKCLSCHRIWFDADELEILQILIENRMITRSTA